MPSLFQWLAMLDEGKPDPKLAEQRSYSEAREQEQRKYSEAREAEQRQYQSKQRSLAQLAGEQEMVAKLRLGDLAQAEQRQYQEGKELQHLRLADMEREEAKKYQEARALEARTYEEQKWAERENHQTMQQSGAQLLGLLNSTRNNPEVFRNLRNLINSNPAARHVLESSHPKEVVDTFLSDASVPTPEQQEQQFVQNTLLRARSELAIARSPEAQELNRVKLMQENTKDLADAKRQKIAKMEANTDTFKGIYGNLLTFAYDASNDELQTPEGYEKAMRELESNSTSVGRIGGLTKGDTYVGKVVKEYLGSRVRPDITPSSEEKFKAYEAKIAADVARTVYLGERGGKPTFRVRVLTQDKTGGMVLNDRIVSTKWTDEGKPEIPDELAAYMRDLEFGSLISTSPSPYFFQAKRGLMRALAKAKKKKVVDMKADRKTKYADYNAWLKSVRNEVEGEEVSSEE